MNILEKFVDLIRFEVVGKIRQSPSRNSKDATCQIGRNSPLQSEKSKKTTQRGKHGLCRPQHISGGLTFRELDNIRSTKFAVILTLLSQLLVQETSSNMNPISYPLFSNSPLFDQLSANSLRSADGNRSHQVTEIRVQC